MLQIVWLQRGRVKRMNVLVLIVACDFLLIISLMEERNGVVLNWR
jgi:hypothetical protein